LGSFDMAYAFPQDIQQQLDQLMATGVFLSEEEVIRQAMSNLAAQQTDLAAIAASLRDFDDGERGWPAANTVLAVREKLGLKS
jgi:Arc/MetJ-type ribon-helix-helix transcriptional regulator